MFRIVSVEFKRREIEMDIDPHEVDHMPMPITASYGHAHMIREAPPRNHITNSTAPPQPPPPLQSSCPISSTSMEDQIVPYKKMVRYRECLKNHAASMGGNATDGCGEFMPSGEEGTMEALKCSACNCHRNFHRREVEGEASNNSYDYYHLKGRKVVGQKGVLIAGSDAFGYHAGGLVARPHSQMIMSYNMGSLPSESDEMEGGERAMARPPLMKKRFRTKFTPDQKEKMLSFAEKVGWRMQKQEALVQKFCEEIGIKRRVLKVWMHNNKHNMAKKASSPPPLGY